MSCPWKVLFVWALIISAGLSAAEPAAPKGASGQSKGAKAKADSPAAETPAAAEAGRLPEIAAAEGMLRAGDIEGARKKLAEAQKKNPSLAAPGVIIARWLAANNQIGPARAELERVVTDLPEEPEAYALLGELAWRDGRPAETELLFREALTLAQSIKDPTRKAEIVGAAHAGLATVAEARGRWLVARDELTSWAALDEENPNPHLRLAVTLFHLGKSKQALAEYQKAAKQNRDLVPEVALAALYEGAGDHENALRWFNAALKRLPNHAGVRLAMANWELRNNRIDEAKRQVEAALKIDPESLEAKILAGGIARLEHDYATAQRYLESAHSQSPTDFTASNLWALALADGDDPAKQAQALELAQQNFERAPNNSEAIATLGWVLFRLGRFDEANERLQQALNTGTLNADGAYFVARMCQREGNLADAKTLLSKALATKLRFAYQDDAEKLLADLQAGDAKPAAQPKAAKKPAPAGK